MSISCGQPSLDEKPEREILDASVVHGYTLFAVEGDGSQGKRPGDIPKFANIQIEVVVSPAVADTLLTRVGKEFFPRYAMIAFECEVRVLRKEEFQPDFVPCPLETSPFHEGPFGDHAGYYTLPEPHPVFHVTAITHRKDAVYPATIVSISPMEDFYIGARP